MIINVLEMMAVSQAPAAFLPQLSGQCVFLLNDNATVVTSLWLQGGTVFHVLCRMTVKVILWSSVIRSP